MDVSVPAAFAGGVLAILSPCSALLLPAFFALATASRRALLGQALFFYLGLATIFVPLGLGVSAVAALFLGQRDLIIVVAGLALVAFGVYSLAGGGFALAPGLAARFERVEGRFAAYAIGLAYGFAGFCAGPILGGVLTIAAGSGQALSGGALLAVYALGVTVPVFVLAAAWDRWRIGERGWLRDRTFRAGPIVIPVSRLLSGALFVALGVSYIVFQGSSALSGLYESLGIADLGHRLEETLLGSGSR